MLAAVVSGCRCRVPLASVRRASARSVAPGLRCAGRRSRVPVRICATGHVFGRAYASRVDPMAVGSPLWLMRMQAAHAPASSPPASGGAAAEQATGGAGSSDGGNESDGAGSADGVVSLDSNSAATADAMRSVESGGDAPSRWGWTQAEAANIRNFFITMYQDAEVLREVNQRHFIDDTLWPSVMRKIRASVTHNPSEYFDSHEAGKAFAAAPHTDFVVEVAGRLAKTTFLEQVEGNMVLAQSADLRLPHMWYPVTRLMKRKIVYHAGPTNSGKTYNALNALREAKTGVFCSPLRLLALEVYENLNMSGVITNLVTGQEKKEMPFAKHVACTVEVARLDVPVDVAVIDEIQMIGAPDRGWAWTQAVLGLQAKEVHVCGDASAVDVVRRLAELCNDEFELVEYKRRSKLKVLDESLGGDLSKVREGDCIVAFSRRDIHNLRSELEQEGFKCGVVYGKLPPETRSAQARMFNSDDPSSPSVLIASDAIGMGLNLNIRRVVFATVTKFDGVSRGNVPISSMKQIAGRAGRFGSRWPVGEVTCLNDDGMEHLRNSIEAPLPPLASVGLMPSLENMQAFSKLLPGHSLHQLLERFEKATMLDSLYFLCQLRDMKGLAKLVADVGLSIEDQFLFSCAPVNARDKEPSAAFTEFAKQFASGKPVQMHVQLPLLKPNSDMDLQRFEKRHQVLDSYLWLARRFPGRFLDATVANEKRIEAATMLEEGLQQLSRNTAMFLERKARRMQDKHRRHQPRPRGAAARGGERSRPRQRSGKGDWSRQRQHASNAGRDSSSKSRGSGRDSGGPSMRVEAFRRGQDARDTSGSRANAAETKERATASASL